MIKIYIYIYNWGKVEEVILNLQRNASSDFLLCRTKSLFLPCQHSSMFDWVFKCMSKLWTPAPENAFPLFMLLIIFYFNSEFKPSRLCPYSIFSYPHSFPLKKISAEKPISRVNKLKYNDVTRLIVAKRHTKRGRFAFTLHLFIYFNCGWSILLSWDQTYSTDLRIVRIDGIIVHTLL